MNSFNSPKYGVLSGIEEDTTQKYLYSSRLYWIDYSRSDNYAFWKCSYFVKFWREEQPVKVLLRQ